MKSGVVESWDFGPVIQQISLDYGHSQSGQVSGQHAGLWVETRQGRPQLLFSAKECLHDFGQAEPFHVSCDSLRIKPTDRSPAAIRCSRSPCLWTAFTEILWRPDHLPHD